MLKRIEIGMDVYICKVFDENTKKTKMPKLLMHVHYTM